MSDGYGLSTTFSYVVVSSNFPLDGDFGTIQDAIDSGACAIYVRAGTYQPGQSITVPAGVTIIGESKLGTVIDFEGNAWGFVLTGSDNSIRELNVTSSGNSLGAFVFNTVTNATVADCNISASTRAAIFLGSTYCHFNKNHCQGQSDAQVFVDTTSTDNRIQDNRLTGGLHYGIILEGAFNKVHGNNASGHMYDGVLVKSKLNSIMGNTCNQNENGIYVARDMGDHNHVVGNVCYNNRGYGININDLDNSGNLVTGNNTKGNGVADIRFVPGNQAATNDADNIV